MKVFRKPVLGAAVSLITAALVAAGGVVGLSPAQAAGPPQHVNFPIDFSGSFDDCGFVVDFVQTETLHETLWFNGAGLVARETDTVSAGHVTFTKTETDKTFSTPINGTVFSDYGAGAALGSSVIITDVGTLSPFRARARRRSACAHWHRGGLRR
jgi:hypothetical protein